MKKTFFNQNSEIFRYNFRLLDTSGWNFRHAHYHEEGRRTLYKAYGIKFVIIVQGRAGKSLFNINHRKNKFQSCVQESFQTINVFDLETLCILREALYSLDRTFSLSHLLESTRHNINNLGIPKVFVSNRILLTVIHYYAFPHHILRIKCLQKFQKILLKENTS